MHEMNQYGACEKTVPSITIDFYNSRTEPICTTVIKVDKVSKHYMISESDYNSFKLSSKVYSIMGGIAVVLAIASTIQHFTIENPNSRIPINFIMSGLFAGIILAGIGIAMGRPLAYMQAYELRTNS